MIGYVMGENVCEKDLIEYGKYAELKDDYESRTKYSLLILILAVLFMGIVATICITLLFIYLMEQFKKKKEKKM